MVIKMNLMKVNKIKYETLYCFLYSQYVVTLRYIKVVYAGGTRGIVTVGVTRAAYVHFVSSLQGVGVVANIT